MKNIIFYLNLNDEKLKGFDKISKNMFDLDENILNYISKNSEGKFLLESLRSSKKFNIEKQENLDELWTSFNWETSADFHFSTKNYPFLNYKNMKTTKKDLKIMTEYKSSANPPNIYLKRNGESISLPKPNKLILSVGEKAYADNELDLDKLSTMLYYSIGEIGKMDLPVISYSLLKTSPSGGARHPTEGYLINFGIDALKEGVFHYDVENHALVKVNECLDYDVLKKVFFQLNHRHNLKPKALFVFTSRFERNMWRYREPRTFRVIFMDMGHIIANTKLVLNSLNIKNFCGHGFKDEDVEELLLVNGYEEAPFYFFALY
jgi:SagB-type dehydrogenase family enzyme